MVARGNIRILVIADHPKAMRELSAFLQEETGFDVLPAFRMEEGITKAQVEWPSLILLDLPHIQMLEVCRVLKLDRGTRAIPIIILTGADTIDDRIAGLEAGVDDYIGKPCHPREVILRIKAVLRRGQQVVAQEQFVRGPIRLDPARCDVAVDNRKVHLTAVEFKLLRSLVSQPGQVKSREALQNEARTGIELVESRTIDTHIRRLRKKLGKAAHLVETVRGSGYRLRPV